MATESDYNSYKALKARGLLICEFCDQVFNNRFSSIVHNSSHIIIPLLKNHVRQCDICYVYFTSTEDFNIHMSEKHPPVINNYKNDIKFNLKVPAVELEKLPPISSDKCKVKEEIFVGDEYDSSSSEDELLDMVKRKRERELIRDESKNEEEYTDLIKSQLKFEVDHEHKGVLKDFTTNCQVNIQYTWGINNNKNSETFKKNKQSITNNIVFEEPVDVFEFDNPLPPVPLSDDKYESVHYNDLISFGIFKCIYCCVPFSNRLSLIIHETTHMKINKTRNTYLLCHQCDRYIAGNHRTLKRHEATVHGTVCRNKRELRTCNACGLRYRKYSRHNRNYHYESLERSNHLAYPSEAVQESIQNDLMEKTSIIKVCNLCFSFFKNSFKKIYILKDTFSDTTERPCDECKKKFFTLKTVKTITRIHKTSQLNRNTIRQLYTNETRLKNIQIRLKMINKLSKFYNNVLLMSVIHVPTNQSRINRLRYNNSVLVD